MKCDICGKTVDRIYVCSDCNSFFCEKCGFPEKEKCKECDAFEF
jgi:predicted nucleic acid binding AN1-type Zn finger protein